MRPRRLAVLALLTVLCTLLVGFGSAVTAGAGALHVAAAQPTVLTGTIAGADYRIEMPENWNGTLVLYSHGYVVPGQPNPARSVSDPVTGAYLLEQGYALAGSSYSATGYAVEQALVDQIALLDFFVGRFGQPRRTIAWGDSLGGIISAGLIQRHPERFSAALPICGVLAGSVATWNNALDGAFVFKVLLAADTPLRVVRITDPAGNLQLAQQTLAAARETPEGRARLALSLAVGNVPDWFDPAGPEPARDDYAARLQNQALWAQRVNFPFLFALRAELEARAGGNPSWSVGVDYREQLARSAERDLVEALYAQAGLSLEADLQALATAPRITQDNRAAEYLIRNIVFNGQIAIPVLTLHTTDDGLVPVQNEQAYADVVRAAGNERLLRQLYVRRAGHCTLTPAERLVALQAIVRRLDTGNWGGLDPQALNGAASALGPGRNVLSVGGNVVPIAPAFVQYEPSPYLRPFDVRSSLPAPAPPTGSGGNLPGLPNTGGGGTIVELGARRALPAGAGLVAALGLGAGAALRRRRAA